jgi:hypothetical protein
MRMRGIAAWIRRQAGLDEGVAAPPSAVAEVAHKAPVRPRPVPTTAIAVAVPPPTRTGSATFLRAVTRYPHLAPPDHTLDAYAEWLKGLGVVLDEIDDEARIESLLADHASICRLMGWPLPGDIGRQSRHRVPQTAPGAAALSEAPSAMNEALRAGTECLDASSGAPSAADEAPEGDLGHSRLPVPAPALGASPALAIESRHGEPIPGFMEIKAREAAERFVEWLRLTGRVGTRPAAQITHDYALHCKVEDLVPVSDTVLREAMKSLPGVAKRKVNTLCETRTGRQVRRRPTEWIIEPLAGETESPWTDLPKRRVA